MLAGENATLFMGLMAVYNILLFMLSGREDIVVGTPTAGRNHPDLAGIIGVFVNMLVLRNFPGPGKTFSGFLQEMKSKVLKALENQDYQFEDLVMKLSLQRETGQNPLFEIMFTLQNAAEEGMDRSGLEEAFIDIATGASKFDLGLEVIEFGDLLYCRFEYKTRLFKDETIRRFAEYFKQIMTQVTENKDILLKDIGLEQDILEPTVPVMDVKFSF
jgi:non-ribosomal peptide synthetase component F